MSKLRNFKKDSSIEKQLVQLGIFDGAPGTVRTSNGKNYPETTMRWSVEEDFYLKTVYPKWKGSRLAFAKTFNDALHTNRSLGAIRTRLSSLGIKMSAEVPQAAMWSHEELQYLKDTYPSFIGDIYGYTTEFNKKFNTNRTTSNIYYKASNEKIKRTPEALKESKLIREGIINPTKQDVEPNNQTPPAVSTPESITKSSISFPVKAKKKNVFLRIYDAIFNS